jgi:hypothetical protein
LGTALRAVDGSTSFGTGTSAVASSIVTSVLTSNAAAALGELTGTGGPGGTDGGLRAATEGGASVAVGDEA